MSALSNWKNNNEYCPSCFNNRGYNLFSEGNRHSFCISEKCNWEGKYNELLSISKLRKLKLKKLNEKRKN